MVKPFKHILLEGKPTKKIAFTFYAEDGDCRIIGAFCYTHGKRILFFPGLTLSRVKHSPDNREMLHEMHRIDHFSVEDSVINWHVTLEGKKAKNHKYPTLKTKMINEGIFLWFVMGIPNLQIMEPLPETQIYSIKYKKTSERDHKLNSLLEARHGSMFPVLNWTDHTPAPNFINFEIFVLTKGKKVSDLPEGLFVFPQHHPKFEMKHDGVKSRAIYPFRIDSSISICIRASKITGTLDDEAGFFSGGGYA